MRLENPSAGRTAQGSRDPGEEKKLKGMPKKLQKAELGERKLQETDLKIGVTGGKFLDSQRCFKRNQPHFETGTLKQEGEETAE